jgi:glycogen debranching enzyme
MTASGMLGEVRVGPNIIIINRGRAFMVSGLDGSIRGAAEQGLFSHDIRFLSHYRHLINGRNWTPVTSVPLSQVSARFVFTNPALASAVGPIPKHVLGLAVTRTISDGVHEDLDLVNYHQRPVRLTLEIEVGSDFADLFEVRRHYPRIRRTVRTHWEAAAQRLDTEYERDGYHPRFSYEFSRSDTRARHQGSSLLFDIVLPPGGRWHTCARLIPEVDGIVYAAPSGCGLVSVAGRDTLLDAWRASAAHFRTNDDTITHILRQSTDDLVSLLLDDVPPETPGVLAAGAPWFVALFGRDSLIAGMQTLTLHRSFGLGALAALARHQATRSDDVRDADPGKIPHELRSGELARFGLIPHTPYYGTADATILYPILLHEAYLWTGDRGLLETYLPVAARCLDWVDAYGDRDGDGFQEYRTRSPRGIKHQGWKDSGDGVVYENGEPAEPPIALCELQGYVYDAKRRMAALYETVGNLGTAGHLRREAQDLLGRFNDAFWLDDEGTYAYGLDALKHPITSVVSNAGHCLWSGIVPPERAPRVIARLTADDMWSGWGIRTLSAAHPAFNPFAYQRGAVWPHDNALIAAGCRRYGDAAAAAKIARAIFDAAAQFQRFQLPELLSGLDRTRFDFPVRYLDANVPQAWAAGSVFFLIRTLLGLRADAPAGRMYVAPRLPEWLSQVHVDNLRVGDARVAFRCWREGDQSCFEVEDITGRLDVVPAEELEVPVR